MNARTPVDLRPYRDEHLRELVRLWREAFEGGVGIVDPHPIAEQEHYFQATVLPHHDVQLAFAGDRLAGFVAASRESVAQLHVRVGLQRRGIGSTLLAWAQAQSGGSLWLYTFARNVIACRFYERHGFVAVAHGFEPHWQLADVKYEWTADRGAATDRTARS